MTQGQLERILSEKGAPGRDNISLILSPEITRASLRLKKRQRDRRNLMVLLLAALAFVLAALGLGWALAHSETPGTLLKFTGYALLGGMSMTLLLSPALAWFLESDR